MGRIIFVTGGARSGKSGYALSRAMAHGGPKGYIATAEALDEEMRQRIERHKRERGLEWVNVEAPVEIVAALRELSLKLSGGIVIIDCLTLWVSNMMSRGKGTEAEAEEAARALCDELRRAKFDALIVTNEVGMGIVPDNPISRQFRDMAGRVNQTVAASADEAYLVVSGLAIKIK